MHARARASRRGPPLATRSLFVRGARSSRSARLSLLGLLALRLVSVVRVRLRLPHCQGARVGCSSKGESSCCDLGEVGKCAREKLTQHVSRVLRSYGRPLAGAHPFVLLVHGRRWGVPKVQCLARIDQAVHERAHGGAAGDDRARLQGCPCVFMPVDVSICARLAEGLREESMDFGEFTDKTLAMYY